MNKQENSQRRFIPVFAILGNWLIMGAAVGLAEAYPSVWLKISVLFLIAARQHALLVLTHEAVHMNLGWNRASNDILADVFCSFPLLFDTQSYRLNHLKHHSHLNTQADPDWVRKVGQKDSTFPITPKKVLRFLPYFIFWKGPIEWLYIGWKFSGFGDRARWMRRPRFLLSKAFYFLAAAAALFEVGCLEKFAFYWLLPLLFIFPTIQRLRSIAEHFSLPYTNDLTSSRDVETSWLEGFLLSPFNVNYHLTHHFYPHIPFYKLPAFRRSLQNGELKNAYTNSSYLFPLRHSVLADILNGPQMMPAEQVKEQKAA